MRVTGRTTSGLSPFNSAQEGKAAKGSTAQSSQGYAQVSLSPEALALYEGAVASGAEVRDDAVAAARQMISDGTLDSDANIDKALDRLMADLF